MNGFEIRYGLLEQARTILLEEFNNKTAIVHMNKDFGPPGSTASDLLKDIKAPSTEDIMACAKKLYEFVQEKDGTKRS